MLARGADRQRRLLQLRLKLAFGVFQVLLHQGACSIDVTFLDRNRDSLW